VKHLTLVLALATLASPAFAALSTWADPYGRSITPPSTWTTSSTAGVFGGVAPRSAEEGQSESGGESETEAPPPTPAPGPVMSLSITASGLLDFVFQQLYASFSGEEAERIRAVLAPQYAAMALHLQEAFGGAEMVAYPEGTPAPETGGEASGGDGSSPENVPAPQAPNAALRSSTSPLLAAPSASEPLSVTQSMAVVAATSILVNPEPTLSGTSTNMFLLTGADSVTLTPLDTAAVPEPSTFGLIGAGLAAVLLRRRRA